MLPVPAHQAASGSILVDVAPYAPEDDFGVCMRASSNDRRTDLDGGCEVHRQVGSPTHSRQVVGVDVGVKALAVISTGEVVENTKPLFLAAKRVARKQRRLARQQTGGSGEPASRRSRRTRARIARTHAKVAHLRADALHKLTTRLARTYGTVVVEDLNVAGMTSRPALRPDQGGSGHHLRNGARIKAGLNRAILDASPGELRHQLAYKCEWYGSHLVVADRWFPSSKTCSSCRTVKTKLSLSERTFQCETCGLTIDRDLNAARNLAALVQHVAASGVETQNGRGGERSQAGATSRCSPLKRQAGTEQSARTGTAFFARRGCAKRLHMFQATVASGAWPPNRPNPAPRSWRSRLSGTRRSWRR
jgi:putative transposase